MRLPLGLPCSVVLALGIVAAPTAAVSASASGWTVDPITMTSYDTTELVSLDCADDVTDGTCIAVGSTTDTDQGRHPLIERRGAAGWSDIPIGQPRNTSDAELTSISCVAATHCIAVGRAAYGSKIRVLIDRSTAAGWREQSSPEPRAGDVAELSRISCVSASFCVAVGDTGTSTRRSARIETWDGTAWHLVDAPDTGFASTKLLGVACLSPVFCAAVGAAGPSATTTTSTVQEIWNGSTWSLGTAQSGDSAELTAVDCVSSTFCLAVGQVTTAQGVLLAGERWDGTSWSATNVAARSGRNPVLRAVACASKTYCLATGTRDEAPLHSAFARRWNGSKFIDAPEPSPPWLPVLAVRCFSAGQCEGVGAGGEYFDGSGWELESTPYHAGSARSTRLTAVSCRVSSCLAAGAHPSAGEDYPLSLQSFGGGWVTVRDLPSADFESINALSCGTRSSLCMSSGYYEPKSTEQTIVEYFDGEEWWVEQGVPDVGPSAAISCAASFCVVTGVGAVATYDGTSWTSKPITGPRGADVQLNGVDCLAADDCVMVGGYYGDSRNVEYALVEQWNGTSWHVVAAPRGRSGALNALRAVSCHSASSCVAVGTSSGSPDASLVYRWNGTTWRSVAHPATGTGLHGVACASAGSCVAVGPNGAALQSTHGTWARSRIADPPGNGGVLPDLTGVSFDGQNYHAVGTYDRLGDQTAVVESLRKSA